MPDIALVFAQLGIARTREGLASLLERRLVAWAALDRFLANGPADLTAERVCLESADRLRAVLGAAPGGLTKFSMTGPSGTSATRCSFARFGVCPSGPARETPVPRRARSHSGSLPDRRWASPQRRRHQPLSGAPLPVGRSRQTSSVGGVWARAGCGRRHLRFQPRPQRRAGARAEADVRGRAGPVPPDSRRTFACSTLPTCSTARSSCCGGWTNSRRAGFGSRRAFTTCSSTSFRIRAARNGSSSRCSSSPGARALARRRARRFSWSGTASSRSIDFETQRQRCCRRRRDISRPSGPRATHAVPLRGAFEPCRPLLAFVNELFTEWPTRSRGRALHLHRERPFPDHGHGTRPRHGSGHGLHGSHRQARDADHPRGADRADNPGNRDNTKRFELGIAAANDPVVCASLVADEIARILREDSVRDRRTGVPRRARRGYRRTVPVARQPSRVRARARAARCPGLRLQGLGLLRR